MKTQAYRPEIDGLRAIAVLAVVAYHVAPTAISGGFVGVDVFFVISGYLISGILLREIEQGHFQLRHFYARRVLRIFPALATVLSAVLVYAWFASSPRELSALGAHAAAGAAFVANIFYWRESGYFDSAAELKPLLHLWSLGIEEQFYIVWPLVLIIAARCRLRVTPVLLLLGIASFALNLFQAHHAPSAAFFLPGARVWELLIGAALAEAERSGRSIGHRALANAAALIGLMMISLAVVHVNRAMSFPGWWAVFPTVGAALVIAAGAQSSVNRVVLASRPMIFVGLISYPLYLWHGPPIGGLKNRCAPMLKADRLFGH